MAYQVAKFNATDVVFTDVNNPGATGTVPVSMNLVIRARYVPTGASNCNPNDPRGGIVFNVDCPFDNLTRVRGARQSFGAQFTEFETLVDFPNDGSPTPVTSPSSVVNLGQARTLHMDVEGTGTTQYCDRPPAAIGSVDDFIEVGLPRGTPVFNLPAGFTANSVHANIVNNIWQGPCPADYNGDGFVDGIDYDQFNNDFESTDPIQQRHADYNYDGFVDGIDYDQFNNDFEAGC
jgi:hypothetical protein